MGFDEILTAIALGTRLTKAVVSSKRHVDDLRSSAAPKTLQPSPIDALDRRTSDLESLARRQAARISDLEIGLEDAAVVTTALAERVSTIFWIAVLSGTVALISLILSIFTIAYRG
jgi:predicted nucleic acid-binding protein